MAKAAKFWAHRHMQKPAEKSGWPTGFEPATTRSTIWGSNQAELRPPANAREANFVYFQRQAPSPVSGRGAPNSAFATGIIHFPSRQAFFAAISLLYRAHFTDRLRAWLFSKPASCSVEWSPLSWRSWNTPPKSNPTRRAGISSRKEIPATAFTLFSKAKFKSHVCSDRI